MPIQQLLTLLKKNWRCHNIKELFDRHDLKASWVITVAIHDWLQNAYVRAIWIRVYFCSWMT